MNTDEQLAASDEILARLGALHPKSIDLSLSRVNRLLKALGDPQDSLPPVIHIAGTNGKGSTTANVRAIAEAAGHRVHVYTSPHLVRFHERIRIAGQLISDEMLTDILLAVETANAGEPITFFEVTTAAALLAFSKVPADLCILEVGLGGRLDATNVVKAPLATIITPISFDHQQFLGNTIDLIAAEKAGIIKKGVPVIVGNQLGSAWQMIRRKSQALEAPMYSYGIDWHISANDKSVHFDADGKSLELPFPSLLGSHQVINAGMAITALKTQSKLIIPDAAIKAGLGWVRWPARLQNLSKSSLMRHLPVGSELWLDGGHNVAAAGTIRNFILSKTDGDRPAKLIIGMMGPKDAEGFIRPLANLVDQVIAVPIPGESGAAEPSALAATATDIGLNGVMASSIEAALDRINMEADLENPPFVMIAGSLYLAGNVLRSAGILPE